MKPIFSLAKAAAWFFMLALCCNLPFAVAAPSAIALDNPHHDLSDKASLQRGARTFFNYCLGCHSTQYQRYQRIANDLAIPEPLMMQHLVFDPNAKIGDLIDNALTVDDGNTFFGVAPPDLTLVARVRGTDWLYTYLRSFYVDDGKVFGVNNLVFPNVGMPHVLEELQGTPVEQSQSVLVDGQSVAQIVEIRSLGNGELSTDEYDALIKDLVNFLDYSAEPFKLERQALGRWVIGFFVLFLILAILLKKEYWRDVV